MILDQWRDSLDLDQNIQTQVVHVAMDMLASADEWSGGRGAERKHFHLKFQCSFVTTAGFVLVKALRLLLTAAGLCLPRSDGRRKGERQRRVARRSIPIGSAAIASARNAGPLQRQRSANNHGTALAESIWPLSALNILRAALQPLGLFGSTGRAAAA